VTSDFNAALRAAVRGPAADPAKQPEGDLGGGRGGSARPMHVQESFGVQFNREVRLAYGIVRGRLSIDDVLPNS
jgi:hypothetical protein